MIWREFSGRLREVLELEGSPIAVTYSNEPVSGAKRGKHFVCEALLDARGGATINLHAKNSACRAGGWYLGIEPKPTGEAYKAIENFLVKGGKLCGSAMAFRKMQALTSPYPQGLANFVVFSPLDQAELQPDLVVFLCDAMQTCRLVTLATFTHGQSPRLELAGPTCHTVISYPLVSGELNLSLMDYTTREQRLFRRDELFVSVPYQKMPSLVDSIEKCAAGTAPVEYPAEFRRLIWGEREEPSGE